MLLVKNNPIFISIQGEGVFTGCPNIFLRLYGCNIKCPWCDTKESWKDEENFIDLDVDEIIKQILKFAHKDVCVTGGEPFIQKEELYELSRWLHNYDRFVSVETNATIYYPIPHISFYSLSPKFGSWDDEVITKWVEYLIYTNTQFIVKVVCKNIDDIKAAQYKLKKIQEGRFFVQPLWKCKEYKRVIDYCIENDVRLSLQMHKYIGVL